MRTTSEDILKGPIGPTLIRMTGPMVVGILVMILFQAVDTFFVSLLGTVQLAAISFTFPVTFTITNLGVGFGIGVSIMLAKAIGRGERTTARRIIRDTLLLVVLLVGFVSVLGLATVDPVFRLLGATDETLPYVHEYMDIWYMAVGLMILLIAGNGVLRATGDTKLPSLLLMLSSIMNAVLDPVLIFGMGPVPAMGVKGAAVATVISWCMSFIASIWILRVREKMLIFSLPKLKPMLALWGELCRISLPISAANMLTPVATMVLTALIARYGEHAVAGFGAGSRIESIAVVVCIAMTSALSPYMAQNLGAGNLHRARSAMNLALRFAMLFQLSLYPLIALTSPWLARIFSSDPAVIEVTKIFLWTMPIGFGFYGVLIIINTGFNAAQQSHKTLLSSLIRLFLCYAPGAWIGGLLFGIPGLFVGAVAGNGMAAWIAWRMVTNVYDAIAREQADVEEADDFALNKINEVELKAVQVD